MTFPEFRVPVESYRVGQDGQLWLKREDEFQGTSTWVILDPEGRTRGRLQLPSSVSVKWINGDTLLAVRTDANNVPSLVRYRLAPISPASLPHGAG